MLAASPGLSRVHWDECRRLAPLVPPPPQDYPQGALGVFRGQSVDFILAHAGLDAEGRPRVHYLLLTAAVLRQVAGRVTLLLPLAADAAPAVRAASLPSAQMATPPPPTVEDQVEDLGNLMLALQDNFQAVEGMLAGVVQGIPVGIIRGPRDLEAQLAFLQGLLTLLPIPARFGVTFATFSRRLKHTQAQIAFLAGDVPPEDCLCYDWQEGRLSGPLPEDPYSRFIVRQLRLDPALAVEHLVALTRTAGWRLTRGEPLAQALGWAARRVALDAAVAEGQPADSEMVAAVLREDPTLSDELRVRYVRHLLAFVLALEEPEPAEIIAILARAHADVAEHVLAMLDEAIDEGKTHLVYSLVASWLANPLGPEGSGWRRRAYRAASLYLRQLADAGDIEGAIAFLEEVQNAAEKLLISEAAPDLLETALPLAGESPALARTLFLLAADHLPAAAFQRLVRTEDFARQLPPALQMALEHFRSGPPTPAPAGMLAQVAGEFGEAWELVVLARLVEWAIALERSDLVDTPTLERLVALARSPWKARFQTVLRHVVGDFAGSSLLLLLDPPGPRLLVEILLLLGDYPQVVRLLERVSTTLFRGDEQVGFAPWVSEVFEHTALETEALLEALEAIEQLGLKPVPAAMARRGALINRAFDPALEPLFDQLSQALVEDRHLVPLVGYDVALHLLQVHARRQDADRAASLAAVITDSLGGSEEGLGVVGRIWTLLNWNKDVRQAALELLRRYVRQVPAEGAVAIPAQIGRKLGNKVQEMLEPTVVVSRMTGGQGFDVFAEEVHTAVALLHDLVVTYENKPYPSLKRLRSDLDAMAGGLSEAERERLSSNLLEVGRLAYALGSARGRERRGNAEQPLLEGREVPRSAVEALLWLGGYFGGGRAIPLSLEREAMHHVTGRRTVNMLLDETSTICALFERLLGAFPPEQPPTLTLAALKAEVASLWAGLRLYDQRRLQDRLAADAQHLAALIALLSDRGDERALMDSGLGRGLETARREPESALEVLRLLSGYFARKFSL